MLNEMEKIYAAHPSFHDFMVEAAGGQKTGAAFSAEDGAEALAAALGISAEEALKLTAAFVYCDAKAAVKMADIAVAMNLEAIRGETGAFDLRLSAVARPFPGQIECAANVNALLQGSRVTTDEGRYGYGYDTHPRVQDAICVRATPQTHGGSRDFLNWFKDCLEAPDCSPELLEYAANGLITALADLAHISERRAFRLNDTRLSYGLPMNLVPDAAGLNHGYPVVQSNQAAFVAELKLLTLPTAAVKRDTECMASYALFKLVKGMALLRKTLAIEVLMCAQAMDIVHAKIPEIPFGKGTQAVHDELRKTISLMTENRFVSPDMCEAERLVENGALLAAAEAAVGELR